MLSETREKAWAVFNQVFLRERSWICASAAMAAEAGLTVIVDRSVTNRP